MIRSLMDFYQFQDRLFDRLSDDHDIAELRILLGCTTQMLTYSSHELKVAEAIVTTAECLLYASGGNGMKGINAYEKMLENRLNIVKQAKAGAAIITKTREIEKNVNQD